MRFVFPVLSLAVALGSIAIDIMPRTPESPICRYGGCRPDQLVPAIQSSANISNIAIDMLLQDPADPAMWCTYAEFLATRGEKDKAIAAFDRALHQGSAMTAILMRVANFDFANNRVPQALVLVPAILQQTDDFNEVLFSYLDLFKIPNAQLLGSVIPAFEQPAENWFHWSQNHRSLEDLEETWLWTHRNHIESEASTLTLLTNLWSRRSYADAQKIWMEELASQAGDYPAHQLLWNRFFKDEFRSGPFDWRLKDNPAIEYHRQDGLDVRFLGTDNVELTTLQQGTVIGPGRYRLAIEIAAEGLTTDQGPLFQLVDAEDPKRLSVETKPVLGSRPRGWITTDFTAPSGSRAAIFQLVRRWSARVDSKIRGSLHIYQVSLTKIGD